MTETNKGDIPNVTLENLKRTSVNQEIEKGENQLDREADDPFNIKILSARFTQENFDSFIIVSTTLSEECSKLKRNHQKLYREFQNLADRNFQLEADAVKKRDLNTASEKLNELISPFAHKMFNFMCSYCAVVATLIACDIFLKIPEKVLEIIVGSTALTVFGLIGTILTGIFVGARPKPEK